MIDPNEVFQKFAQQAADEFPELRVILDQAKAGLVTEEEALRLLSETVFTNADLSRRFQQMAYAMLETLQEPLEHDGFILHKPTGLPQINPLVEAALIERAQFDGDIPELRTGPKPEGVPPAVSVNTDMRNPVALGQMLKTASNKISNKIAEKEPDRLQYLADIALLDMVEDTTGALVEQDLALAGKSSVTDIVEYRRGQLPDPVIVTQPSGSVLLALSSEERKQSAWVFLSTTQGRRSAVCGVAELVEVKLRGEGFVVSSRSYNPEAKGVLATHSWSVGIDGPRAVQSAFSLIDIAAAAIARGLTQHMGDRRGKVLLEVTSINTVDLRSVGWAGRLLATDLAIESGDT